MTFCPSPTASRPRVGKFPGAGAVLRALWRISLLCLAGSPFPVVTAESSEEGSAGAAAGSGSAAEKSSPREEGKKDAVAPFAPQSAPVFPLQSKFLPNIIDSYDDQESAMEINWEAMSDILIALKNCSQEDLLENVNPEITFKNLMQEPAAHRGEVVQLSGLLRRCIPAKFNANPAGILEGWRGQLSNASGNNIISFICIDPLPEGVSTGQGVKLVGIFMKRFAYEVKGQKLQWSPLVFTRRLDSFSELQQSQAQRDSHAITYGEVLFGILILIMLAVILYHRSKQRAGQGNYFTKLKEARSGPTGNFPKPPHQAPPAKTPK